MIRNEKKSYFWPMTCTNGKCKQKAQRKKSMAKWIIGCNWKGKKTIENLQLFDRHAKSSNKIQWIESFTKMTMDFYIYSFTMLYYSFPFVRLHRFEKTNDKIRNKNNQSRKRMEKIVLAMNDCFYHFVLEWEGITF